MSIRYLELFATCERTTTLLGRLAPQEGRLRRRPSSDDRAATTKALLRLLADLIDFADDHDIDVGPLCRVRNHLGQPSDEGSEQAVGEAIQDAMAKVRQIKGAIHLEGHRSLNAALRGV